MKQGKTVDQPTLSQLKSELKRIRYRSRYQRVLWSTFFALVVVAAFAILCGLNLVVEVADAVEQRLLHVPVGGADAVGALEHDVLEVMGHARGIGLFVLRTCMDDHRTVDLRLVVALAHDDFKTVREAEGLHLQFLLCRCGKAQRQGNDKKTDAFHIV